MVIFLLRDSILGGGEPKEGKKGWGPLGKFQDKMEQNMKYFEEKFDLLIKDFGEKFDAQSLKLDTTLNAMIEEQKETNKLLKEIARK